MRTAGTRLTSDTSFFSSTTKPLKNFFLLFSLGGGKGSCRDHPPPPNHPQVACAAAARTSAALQVPAQQLGREPNGRQLRPRARRPAPRPLPVPRGLSPHSAPRPLAPRPPLRTRGLRVNGGAGARPGLARYLLPPRRMAAASGQRRFLALVLTVRWAFESGPRGWPLEMPDPRLWRSRYPHPSTRSSPASARLPPTPDPSSSGQAPELAGSGTVRLAPNTTRHIFLRMGVGEHLRHKHRGHPQPLSRHPSGEDHSRRV